MSLIPDNLNVLFLAFNKSIAEELKGRVPKNASNISVKTIHSYGYFSLTKDMKIEIDANKYKKMLRQIISFFETDDYEQIKKYQFDLKQMCVLDNFRFDDSEKQEIQDKVGYFNRVLSLCDLGRLNLVDLNNQDIASKHI